MPINQKTIEILTKGAIYILVIEVLLMGACSTSFYQLTLNNSQYSLKDGNTLEQNVYNDTNI